MKLIKEACFKNSINVGDFIFKADNQYILNTQSTTIRRIKSTNFCQAHIIKGKLLILTEIKRNQIIKIKRYR